MTEPPLQLTIDGREVPHDLVVDAAQPRPVLTTAQRLILERIERDGGIRPIDAGELTHQQDRERRRRYRSTDGLSALLRLEARGLVRRAERGWWVGG